MFSPPSVPSNEAVLGLGSDRYIGTIRCVCSDVCMGGSCVATEMELDYLRMQTIDPIYMVTEWSAIKSLDFVLVGLPRNKQHRPVHTQQRQSSTEEIPAALAQ